MTLRNLTSVPREQRAHLTTGQLMARIDGLVRAHPDEEVWNVLQRMDEQNVNQVPVMDGDRFLGMITREGLLHNIRLRAELAV